MLIPNLIVVIAGEVGGTLCISTHPGLDWHNGQRFRAHPAVLAHRASASLCTCSFSRHSYYHPVSNFISGAVYHEQVLCADRQQSSRTGQQKPVDLRKQARYSQHCPVLVPPAWESEHCTSAPPPSPASPASQLEPSSVRS